MHEVMGKRVTYKKLTGKEEVGIKRQRIGKRKS
jgi:hypothetical protein